MSDPVPDSALVKEVTEIIVNAVNLHHVGAEQLTPETSLREGGLELDSIDILEVVVALEQHFGVKINDAEAAKKYFRSIGGVADYIQILKSA
jgi:acyl carrier protein